MKNDFLTSLSSLKGIITNPGRTLGKAMEQKQWTAAFILIVITLLIYTYASAPLRIAKLAEHFSEEEMQYFASPSLETSVLAALLAIFMLFVILSVASFLIYLFYGIGGAEGMYGNYFALVVNASIIDTAIPHLLQSLSILLNIDIAGYFNLATYLPSAPPGDLTFLALSQIDLFSLWYIAVLALGVSAFAKMSLKKSIFIGILYFCFKSVILVLFSYLRFKILGL